MKEFIDSIVDNWDGGWEADDAAKAAQDYAEDATWINAFGVERTGRNEIEEFLAMIFKRESLKNREISNLKREIKFLTDNVAIVFTYAEITGQLNPDGEPLATRKNNQLRVLVHADGQWQIKAHLIADARGNFATNH
jgi:uncharacterized protein (TIGR02246 family)